MTESLRTRDPSRNRAERTEQLALWLIVGAVGIYFSGGLLPPLLHLLGLNSIATVMLSIYSKTCHQIVSRSFFIFDFQCGFCARCTGFYGGLFAGGLYVTLRRSSPSPAPIWVLLFSLLTLVDVVFSLSSETLSGNWFRLLLALPTGFLLAWWALAKLRGKPHATD